MVTARSSGRWAGTALAFVVVAALAALAGVGQALAQQPAPAEAHEAEFTALIGQERGARGLPRYAVADDLVAVARRQAAEMARQDRLHHNPRLTSEVERWQSVGENVGVGMDVGAIHDELMASATHRREILSTRFTEVGVGVTRADDGSIWVTQVFRLPLAEAGTTAARAPRSRRTASRPASPPQVATDAAAGTAGVSAAAEGEAAEATGPEEAPAPEPRPSLEPFAAPATATAFVVPPVEPDVSPPVQVAASLLVTVVAAQAATARRLRLL